MTPLDRGYTFLDADVTAHELLLERFGLWRYGQSFQGNRGTPEIDGGLSLRGSRVDRTGWLGLVDAGHERTHELTQDLRSWTLDRIGSLLEFGFQVAWDSKNHLLVFNHGILRVWHLL